jgi:hypothetical protein
LTSGGGCSGLWVGSLSDPKGGKGISHPRVEGVLTHGLGEFSPMG